METSQMTTFISATFSAVTVCNIIFVFEIIQNSFSWGPPFGPSGPEIPQILPKRYRFGQPIILF